MTPAVCCGSGAAWSCLVTSGRFLIPDHHRGFIDWDTYQANQARIGVNIRPQARQPGTGAVREGCALCRAWPPAGNAAASSPSSTAAPPR